jgi:acetoin utilization deacetylase AcuC-like enzyme
LTTLLITHDASLGHETPAGHPERPDRIRAINTALSGGAFDGLKRSDAPMAAFTDALAAHDADYVAELEAMLPLAGTVSFDADTTASPGSREAILRAVGGARLGVDQVMTGVAANAFCALRPPGHHAEHHRAMGFCFLNNAAIAARHAQRAHGAERVAIIDWDVHHGNGTQHIFWDDASVLFASTHEMPLYPGSGDKSETGEKGTILNAPLRAGDDGVVFRDAFTSLILPRVEAFAPDLIIISAGFDAHIRDPLANLRLVEDDFAWATRALMEIARRRCQGRIVSLLEGGYDLKGLSSSVAAHVGALMEA